MEFQFAYTLLTFFLFLLLLLPLIKKSNPKQKLPPSPWKLPVIGNIHHFVKPGLLPHHILRDLAQKHGPLMQLQLGEVSAIVVSSPRIAELVLKTHGVSFASRPEIMVTKILCYDNKNIAFIPYGEYWRQMRKICVQELLSTKCVQSFSPIRHDEVSRLIANIPGSAGKPVNLSDKVFGYMSSSLCRAAFGERCKLDQNTFVNLVKEILSLAGGFDLADLFPSFKILQLLTGMKFRLSNIHRQTDRIFDKIIDAHIEIREKENGVHIKEDLIDILLEIKERSDLQFPITKDSIKGVIFDMFMGGIETSATLVEWAMSEMVRNPQVMAKAQSEIRQAFKGKKTIDENDVVGLKYLNFVIKETLRLHPPGPLLVPRKCTQTCDIDGYTIPVNTKVIVNAWAIGRDPEYWNDPESFNPERFENSPIDFTGNCFEFIPFGAGRRICPGILFGVANIELLLALLLYHFNWELPPGVNQLDMTENFGATAPRKHQLHLVPTLYDLSQ